MSTTFTKIDKTKIPVAEIGNALTSISDDHILGTAGDIYDTDFHEGAYQSEINRYLDNNFSSYLPLTGGEIKGTVKILDDDNDPLISFGTEYNGIQIGTDDSDYKVNIGSGAIKIGADDSGIQIGYGSYDGSGKISMGSGTINIGPDSGAISIGSGKISMSSGTINIGTDSGAISIGFGKISIGSDFNIGSGEIKIGSDVIIGTSITLGTKDGEALIEFNKITLGNKNTPQIRISAENGTAAIHLGTSGSASQFTIGSEGIITKINRDNNAKSQKSSKLTGAGILFEDKDINESNEFNVYGVKYPLTVLYRDVENNPVEFEYKAGNPVEGDINTPEVPGNNLNTIDLSRGVYYATTSKTATRVSNELTIRTGEGEDDVITYNGQEKQEINIYPEGIGAAPVDHDHDTVYSKLEHTHSYAGSKTVGGAANKVENKLTLNVNGTNTEFDGSAAKTVNINATSVGAATATHDHDNVYSKLEHDHEGIYAPEEHTHSYAGSKTVGGAANQVENKLTLNVNGTNTEFDGSTAKTVNINATSVGAAPAAHNHNDKYSELGHNHDTVYSKLEHNHNDEYSPLGHEHNYAGSKTKGGAAKQVENKLTLNVNGTNTEFDGSAAKTVSINATSVGAAPGNHDHDTVYSKLEHNHNDKYSELGHNHDNIYAKIDWVEEELSYKLGAMQKAADSYLADFASTAETASISNKVSHPLTIKHGTSVKKYDGSENITIDLIDLIEVTYAELVDLKNNSKLNPGSKYCITDYNTVVEKGEFASAEHQFAIIVKALNENTLSEVAYAKQSDNVIYTEGNKIQNCVQYYNDFYYLFDGWQIWNINDMPYALRQVIPSNAIVRRNLGVNNSSNRISLPQGRVKIKVAVRNHRNISYNSALTYAATCYGVDICPYDALVDNNSNTWSNNIVAYDYHVKTYVYDREHNNVSDAAFEYILNVPEAGDYKLCIIVDDTDDIFMNNSKDNRVELGVFGEVYELTVQQDTYFNNCNLNAWELKYCLANDANRFDWANSTGKGVIYYMKDEFDNEAPYDFKNVLINGKYTFNYQINGANYDGSVKYGNRCFGNKLCSDATAETSTNKSGLPKIVFNNTNESAICKFNIFSNNAWNISFGNGCYYNEFIGKCENVSLGNDCFMNVFHEDCVNNTLYDGCTNNIFGNSCVSNTLGFRCSHNNFGNNCSNNNFYEAEGSSNNTFGNSCSGNIFKTDCSFNKFGDNCQSNTLRNCSNNIFGYNCTDNIFANGCSNNKLGSNCTSNKFGTNCNFNELSDFCTENIIGCTSNWTFPDNISQVSEGECTNNVFGYKCTKICLRPNCNYNIFGSCCGIYINTANNSIDNIGMKLNSNCESNSFGTYCAGNYFGDYCSYNKFDDYSSNNTFGIYCQSNITGINVTNCSFGDYVLRCKIGSKSNGCKISKEAGAAGATTTLLNNIKSVEFGNECSVNLYVNDTSTTYLQNYRIANGLSDNIQITGNNPRGRSYITSIGKDSSGAIVQKCLEDVKPYSISTTYSAGKLTVSLI